MAKKVIEWESADGSRFPTEKAALLNDIYDHFRSSFHAFRISISKNDLPTLVENLSTDIPKFEEYLKIRKAETGEGGEIIWPDQ